MIRGLLVDDQPLVRAGLRMLCEAAPLIEVAGEATDGEQAVRLAERLTPEVVLMDLRMPRLDGIEATRRILRNHPATRIVVLTTFDDDDHLYPALDAGPAVSWPRTPSPPSCSARSPARRRERARSARGCSTGS